MDKPKRKKNLYDKNRKLILVCFAMFALLDKLCMIVNLHMLIQNTLIDT